MQQRPDPRLLMASHLLQMSSLELQQSVNQELSENPALESPDDRRCLECEALRGLCPQCAILSAPDNSGLDRYLAQRQGDAEEADLLDLVESPHDLRDHLLAQWGAVASAGTAIIGVFLINNIDEDGYLRCDVQDAARTLLVEEAEVEQALTLLQSLDPAGVGARSLQECLLIQARSMAGDQGIPRHCVAMISDFWKDLAAGRYAAMARGLRCPVLEAEQTADWIRRNLCPYPGGIYRPTWERSGAHRSAAVRPDLIMHLEPDGQLGLTLAGEEMPELQINGHYARMFERMRFHPELFSEAERKHVMDYMSRARNFLRGLSERQSTLRKLGEMLIEEQETFLRSERDEDVRPLTQSRMSAYLQRHESTISRAVAGKFLQLPSGRVVPLSFFFDPSLGVRKLVANVLAAEDPRSPYSDQEITDILRRQGVLIARRTVMKYREQMNILSSRQRVRGTSAGAPAGQ